MRPRKTSDASNTSSASAASRKSATSKKSATSVATSVATSAAFEPPSTLNELLAMARERKERGQTAREITDWISDSVIEYSIILRRDEHPVDYVEDKTAVVMPSSVTGGGAKKKGKKTTVAVPFYHEWKGGKMRTVVVLEQILNPYTFIEIEKKAESSIGRILLSCDKYAEQMAPICAECNGVVICTKTWTRLATPTPAFNHFARGRIIDKKLAEGLYDIVLVEDGTLVTIYYWDRAVEGGIWCLASSNGYDVSTYLWMGQKTFAEVIYELTAMYPEFVRHSGVVLRGARLDFMNLNKNKSYTIGFRHHNFHPLREDPQRIWFVQSVDRDTGLVRYQDDDFPGIPLQVVVDPKVLCPDLRSPTLAMLYDLCRNALEDAKEIIRAKVAARKFLYGFILRPVRTADSKSASRSSTPVPGTPNTPGPLTAPGSLAPGSLASGSLAPGSLAPGSPNAPMSGAGSDSGASTKYRYHDDYHLIESPLLEKIRRLVYDKISHRAFPYVRFHNRLEYKALRAFLIVTEQKNFLALLPAWQDRFKQYEDFVNMLVKKVIHIHRTSSVHPTLISARTLLEEFAAALLAHILAHEKGLTAYSQITEKVVRDYVVIPQYVLIYLRYLEAATK